MKHKIEIDPSTWQYTQPPHRSTRQKKVMIDTESSKLDPSKQGLLADGHSVKHTPRQVRVTEEIEGKIPRQHEVAGAGGVEAWD